MKALSSSLHFLRMLPFLPFSSTNHRCSAIIVEPGDEITKEEKEESFCYAMQLVGSSALSISLQSAIELGVFDIIAREGPGAKLSSSKIAAKIGTKNSEAPMMMDRSSGSSPATLFSIALLLLLMRMKMVRGSDFQRVYSLGPVSKYFVNDEEGGSLGPLLALDLLHES
ncbi:unnamed protein product [Prunus armeniaca]|uniref:O-methyltransferase dimerisation domain-containing protein n=1 Tax=Prunus armeniaca TaxID=36596 RepID=A0A6J5WK84_PRUAR|nr:unnamed protein product [Prunus armeniaca]CAB4300763.1 unnamed protein product [Prunus armeniaca]